MKIILVRYLVVPQDATQVELWFHSWFPFSGYEEVWDSLDGQNYWFDIVHA
jgi:hypothetical protein